MKDGEARPGPPGAVPILCFITLHFLCWESLILLCSFFPVVYYWPHWHFLWPFPKLILPTNLSLWRVSAHAITLQQRASKQWPSLTAKWKYQDVHRNFSNYLCSSIHSSTVLIHLQWPNLCLTFPLGKFECLWLPLYTLIAPERKHNWLLLFYSDFISTMFALSLVLEWDAWEDRNNKFCLQSIHAGVSENLVHHMFKW